MSKNESKTAEQLQQELIAIKEANEKKFKDEIIKICEKYNGTIIPIITFHPNGTQFALDFKIK